MGTGRLRALIRCLHRVARAGDDSSADGVLLERFADNSFFAAAMRLHQAELELCSKRAERIQACEAHWQRMKQVDAIAQTQVKNLMLREADSAVATYYRVDAEIRLERAKAK